MLVAHRTANEGLTSSSRISVAYRVVLQGFARSNREFVTQAKRLTRIFADTIPPPLCPCHPPLL